MNAHSVTMTAPTVTMSWGSLTGCQELHRVANSTCSQQLCQPEADYWSTAVKFEDGNLAKPIACEDRQQDHT